jgi:hypothetical protein
LLFLDRGELAGTPHCFRSAFKDWAAESGVRDEVSQAALAHADPNRVRAAYRRTRFIVERAGLMQRWAEFVCGRDRADAGGLHARGCAREEAYVSAGGLSRTNLGGLAPTATRRRGWQGEIMSCRSMSAGVTSDPMRPPMCAEPLRPPKRKSFLSIREISGELGISDGASGA